MVLARPRPRAFQGPGPGAEFARLVISVALSAPRSTSAESMKSFGFELRPVGSRAPILRRPFAASHAQRTS